MAEFDYDLEACLRYNPQDGITVDTIGAVVAVWEGENDGDDWRWVLAMKDERFAFVQGGCDYTGWDCQSDADSWFAETAEDAAKLAAVHMRYTSNGQAVSDSLLKQLAEGKAETWREAKDRELGVVSGAY